MIDVVVFFLQLL